MPDAVTSAERAGARRRVPAPRPMEGRSAAWSPEAHRASQPASADGYDGRRIPAGSLRLLREDTPLGANLARLGCMGSASRYHTVLGLGDGKARKNWVLNAPPCDFDGTLEGLAHRAVAAGQKRLYLKSDIEITGTTNLRHEDVTLRSLHLNNRPSENPNGCWPFEDDSIGLIYGNSFLCCCGHRDECCGGLRPEPPMLEEFILEVTRVLDRAVPGAALVLRDGPGQHRLYDDPARCWPDAWAQAIQRAVPKSKERYGKEPHVAIVSDGNHLTVVLTLVAPEHVAEVPVPFEFPIDRWIVQGTHDLERRLQRGAPVFLEAPDISNWDMGGGHREQWLSAFDRLAVSQGEYHRGRRPVFVRVGASAGRRGFWVSRQLDHFNVEPNKPCAVAEPRWFARHAVRSALGKGEPLVLEPQEDIGLSAAERWLEAIAHPQHEAPNGAVTLEVPRTSPWRRSFSSVQARVGGWNASMLEVCESDRPEVRISTRAHQEGPA